VGFREAAQAEESPMLDLSHATRDDLVRMILD
jgi:hypothetical protein